MELIRIAFFYLGKRKYDRRMIRSFYTNCERTVNTEDLFAQAFLVNKWNNLSLLWLSYMFANILSAVIA